MGKALAPTNPHPDRLWIDHETGLIHRPNNEPIELVGPTTGREYEDLKKAEKRNEQAMKLLKRQILSTFQCTQCRQKFSGKFARIKWRKVQGIDMETLVCFDPKCDAPVVMIEDAMNLRKVPGGR